MPTLQEECQITVERLRASLIDLYASVGADPETPQVVSRAFKLNASLTWNISKLIKATDGLAAVPHVPGPKSLERVLVATKAKGASEETINSVREAVAEFEHMVEVHVGDRPTLDLIIDGLGSSNGDALQNSRKRSFQGDSGIYGIQARTCMGAYFVAPNAENPELIDLVEVRGYFGVRRLRSDGRHPLFIQRTISDENQEFVKSEWRPLDDNAPNIILAEYNNAGDPEFEVVEVDDGVDLYVKSGQLGNRGKFDCVIADKLIAGVGRYAEGADTTGEIGITPTLPTEQMVFDIVAHKDTAFALDAETFVYAPSTTRVERQQNWATARQIPIQCQVYDLAGSPPAVATPHVTGYAELQAKVFGLLGWNPSDFRGSRLELKYPPLGAAVNRRFVLPAASGDPPGDHTQRRQHHQRQQVYRLEDVVGRPAGLGRRLVVRERRRSQQSNTNRRGPQHRPPPFRGKCATIGSGARPFHPHAPTGAPMHELSIATSIVESICTQLADTPGDLLSVQIRVGAFSGVVPDALHFAWSSACEGTRLESSRLDIEFVEPVVHCTTCDADRTIESVQIMICPACGTPTPDVVAGTELEIITVEIDDAENG